MQKRPRFNYAFVCLCLLLSALPLYSETNDEIQRHLTQRLVGRVLVLRNCYEQKSLRYDASGKPVTAATPGDWTLDGFVRINSIKVKDTRIVVQGARLLVSAAHSQFDFQDDPKKKKGNAVRVELDRSPANTAEQAEIDLSHAFLTAKDSLIDQVPDYWLPCITMAVTGKEEPIGDSRMHFTACSFAPELSDIPGLRAVDGKPHREFPFSIQPSDLQHVGGGTSPPRVIQQIDPQFSDDARRLRYQGTIVTALIVDVSGIPRDIRIVGPLGLGLDKKAVETIQRWRFNPALRNGQPVPVEIAVEVSFHLY